MSLKDKQEKVWANFPASEAERYWNNRKHKKRSRWFAAFISEYKFDSAFEVGVNCGRNLDYILRFTPGIDVGGIDINEAALEFAKEHVPNAKLEHGSIHEMGTTEKYDIVFTSGVLLHVPPGDVDKVIQRCLDKANKYVIHMETNGRDRIINGPAELNPSKKVSHKLRCVHDYVRIYKKLGYVAESEKISEFHETDARHIIIVKKG